MKWWTTIFGAGAIAFVGLFAVIEARMAVETGRVSAPGSERATAGELTGTGGSETSSSSAREVGWEGTRTGGSETDSSSAREVGLEGTGTGGSETSSSSAREVGWEGTGTGGVPPEPVPDMGGAFEACLEREVIATLRARRDSAMWGRFSRARISRDEVQFDLTRVEVPERLREVAHAAVALEIGGAMHLLPIRSTAADRPLEVRVGDAWHPAREWLSNPRNDLAATELTTEAPARARRSGESFEAAVTAQLIAPLEARRAHELQGTLSRVFPAHVDPFEFTRLDEVPAEWAGRCDGAIHLSPWKEEAPLLVPFRAETAGGALEVHADGEWKSPEAWLASLWPDSELEPGAPELRLGDR